MPYFVDVTETDNVECVLDGMAELATADSNIGCVSPTLANALVFSIVNGVYTITCNELTTSFFDVGDRVIVRGSIASNGINNDGCYTIVTSASGSVTVKEPVVAATSVLTTKAGGLGVDEYATFILHPTKRTGQMLVYIWSATNLAEFDVSFVPGGYWASKIETVCPIYQGEADTGDADKMWLVQIETAPYLQTEEEDLAVDGTSSHDIDKKGTLLMRVFPGVIGDPLLVGEIEVAYIMIA